MHNEQEEVDSRGDLEPLPREILVKIGKDYFTNKELVTLSTINKYFYALFQAPLLERRADLYKKASQLHSELPGPLQESFSILMMKDFLVRDKKFEFYPFILKYYPQPIGHEKQVNDTALALHFLASPPENRNNPPPRVDDILRDRGAQPLFSAVNFYILISALMVSYFSLSFYNDRMGLALHWLQDARRGEM